MFERRDFVSLENPHNSLVIRYHHDPSNWCARGRYACLKTNHTSTTNTLETAYTAQRPPARLMATRWICASLQSPRQTSCEWWAINTENVLCFLHKMRQKREIRPLKVGVHVYLNTDHNLVFRPSEFGKASNLCANTYIYIPAVIQ